jgi:hypothetical protein
LDLALLGFVQVFFPSKLSYCTYKPVQLRLIPLKNIKYR